MKFNSIKIKDLFSYQGEAVFKFNSSDSPITLIIGENGFGKTSFINAIKIALHGITKDLLSMGDLVLSKQDFILGNSDKNFSGILNRVSKQNGAKKVSIIIEVEDVDTFYIEREYTIGTNSYSESLNIYDDNTDLIHSDADAQDFINYKISPTLAKFFFFDGEKIQTIADFSKNEFRQMLEDVLELDIYDQLIDDSKSVIKRINQKELDPKIQEKLKKKEEELIELIKEIDSLESKLDQKNIRLKELLSDQKELDNRINSLRSKHKKPLQEAHAKLIELKTTKEALQNSFKELVYIQLPLLLNKKLKDKVEQDIESNYKGNLFISKNIVEIKKKEFLSFIEEAEQNNIEEIFDKVFKTDNNLQSVPFADPEKIEAQYSTFSKVNIDELLESLTKVNRDILSTELEVYSLEKKFQDDKSDSEKDFLKVKSIAEEIGAIKSSIAHLEADSDTLKKSKRDIESDIARTSIKEHKSSLAKLKIDSLEATVKVVEKMKVKIKEDKKNVLEDVINGKFTLLKKEGYEADSIRLDKDFNINVYDKDMNPMDILSSSSGQKQIVATALIWGISEYISEHIPMIIDTPLGRLDEKNQLLILNQFYPNASKQVLILPTPSELRSEGFKNLRGQISQIFVLSNKGSATTIKEQNIKEFFEVGIK